MSSVPLRSRSPFFSFDTERGSRRPRWLVFLAGVVVVLLAAVGVVAGVGAASAHTPSIVASCYQLKVELTSYNGTNDVYVKINGEVKTDQSFGSGFSQTYAFADPTVVNTWTVIVTAHDDRSFKNGWSVKRVDVPTTPCAAPDLTLEGTVCNSVGGTTDLSATFSQLTTGSYTGQLFKDEVLVDTFVATTTGKSWTAMEAGVTYRLTVTSDTQPGLTKSIETFVVGCPQNSELQVGVEQCTSTGSSNASVAVTASSVVPGRSYTATVYQGATPYAGVLPYGFTPAAGQTSVSFTIGGLPENVTGLSVVLTDDGSGSELRSTTFSTLACPDVPAKPAVSVEQCTVVGGDLELTVTPSGLVPTRVYLVLVDDAQVDEFTAAASTEIPRAYAVGAGIHTVTIVDKLVPAAAASSDPVTVVDCPTQPDVALAVTDCSVPGGTGSLTATFSGLGSGREYLVTITEGPGNAVPGHEGPLTVTSESSPVSYDDLAPGATYTVTIVDRLATDVRDAASETLDVCPQTPGITLDLECLLLDGESLITATIDDLEPGADYLVEVVAATPPPAVPSAGSLAAGVLSAGAFSPLAVAVVASETITGGSDPSTVSFQVPNNVEYTVTVTHLVNSAITGSAEIFAAICDLPTFPLPELPTLALTGAGDTAVPMLGALGLVQFGVALLALAAMLQVAPRRRAA